MQIICTVEGEITSFFPEVFLVGDTPNFPWNSLWYGNKKA